MNKQKYEKIMARVNWICINDPFYNKGNWVIIGIFALAYFLSVQTYEFFIGASRTFEEMQSSRIWASIIGDGVLYMIAWLLMKHAPMILPILMLVVVQVASIFCTCLAAEWYYQKKYPQESMLQPVNKRASKKENIKILLLANDTSYVYNLRGEVIRAMLDYDWQVVVVSNLAQHATELAAMGCKLVPLEVGRHGKNPLKDLALKRRYNEILCQEKPDAVLTYNIKPNVYGGMECARQGIPYLVNVCGLGTPVEYPGPMQALTVALYRVGVKRADCVFFQNTENEQFFNDHHMAPGHHHLLPGSGVNLEKFQPMEYPIGDTVEFLFISRVMKEKGADQYLEAAQEIRARHPETVFHVIGGCDDESYLQRLHNLQEQNVIVYHGQQPSVLPYQAKSACTIHPTYYPEGMSNVLLESAACARPIITTGRSGCREIVEDGVNGFICKQKDTQDLVKQIEKFLALSWAERREMGLAARRKVEREFDRQIVVKAYLDEIENAVGEKV